MWLLLIRLKHRSVDQRVKTLPSIRKVALHSALLHEGLLAYRESIPDGRLFPRLSLDIYGKRAGQASNRTGEWLRNVVGITDPDKPFYSLRHSGITDLRVARTASGEIAVKPDIERYLTAQGKKDEHGGYGEFRSRI
ncbi:MAG TPA: hypothetical protein VNZ53_34960 [Steroidobacteraceae bacterium]|nr:hypothetical protein [Steroidobacteraceae bacterium]